MHRKRVENLRRVAASIPPEVLGMKTFTNRCGTTHCLAGWFALDSWAVENTPIRDILDVEVKNGEVYVRTATVDTHTELKEFFGINRLTTERLFFPYQEEFEDGEWYLDGSVEVTPAMLVRNLDHLLNGEPLERYDEMDMSEATQGV